MSSWPVYGLAGAAAEAGFLSWSEVTPDGALKSVTLSYGAPADDEQTEVRSQPLDSDEIESLDHCLAVMYLRDGRDYPVAGALPVPGAGVLPAAPGAEPAEVMVGEVSVSAVVQRMDDYAVWRLVSEKWS